MTTLRKLITGSMRLIRVVGANETPSDEDMQISLQSLRGMLDGMQTDLLNIYTIPYQRFLLEAGKAEYTLGPAVDSAGNPTNADWVVERPVRVERAVLLQFAGISMASPPDEPLNFGFYVVANSDRFAGGAYSVEARQSGGGGYQPLNEGEASAVANDWTTLVNTVGGEYPAETVISPPNWGSTSAPIADTDGSNVIIVDNNMPVSTITLNGGPAANAIGVQLLLKTTDASATLTYTGQVSGAGITTISFTVTDTNGTRTYELIGPALPEGGGVDADFTLERLT